MAIPGASRLNAAKSMVDGLIGSSKHAVIIVWDQRAKLEQDPKKTGQKSKSSIIALKGGAWSVPKPGGFDGGAKTYSVQFNPSTLRVTAHSTPANHAGIGGTAKEKLKRVSMHTVEAPNLDLHVTLVFDRVNIEDAFITDKFSSFASIQAVTNLATAITKKAMASAGKESLWTVQPVVEGFIAALRNPSTRKMTFVWNEFQFEGILKSVNADYTMFSTAGRPIRANVALRLSQEMNSTNQDYWADSFTKVFGANGGINKAKKLF